MLALPLRGIKNNTYVQNVAVTKQCDCHTMAFRQDGARQVLPLTSDPPAHMR